MSARHCSELVARMGCRLERSSHVWRRIAGHRALMGLDSQVGKTPLPGESMTRSELKSQPMIFRWSSSTSLHFAKRIPVQVGASLEIDVSRTTAGVNVTVGGNLEEVLMLPRWLRTDECGQGWKLLQVTSSDNQLIVQQAKVQSQGLQLQEVLEEMNAHMPARWCSLIVKAGVGPVYIQNVREGDLSVRTAGGDVKLGEMKGSEASVDTGGGNVEANVVQAKSSFQTGGGKLSVNRLQGTSIALDSGGGSVVLGSLYGDDVIVESKGGSVEAKEIQAQNKALVCSSGGSVVINGVDGKVAINSQGGNVDLQLNEHAEEVTVDAGENGRVVLSLSARLSAQLKYEGSEGVVQEGTILTSGQGFGFFHFTGSEVASNRKVTNSGWRGSENYLPGGVTACKIHVSSACQVLVKQRSWFELVTSRVS